MTSLNSLRSCNEPRVIADPGDAPGWRRTVPAARVAAVAGLHGHRRDETGFTPARSAAIGEPVSCIDGLRSLTSGGDADTVTGMRLRENQDLCVY